MTAKRIVSAIGLLLGVAVMVLGMFATLTELPRYVTYVATLLGLVSFLIAGIVFDEAGGGGASQAEQTNEEKKGGSMKKLTAFWTTHLIATIIVVFLFGWNGYTGAWLFVSGLAALLSLGLVVITRRALTGPLEDRHFFMKLLFSILGAVGGLIVVAGILILSFAGVFLVPPPRLTLSQQVNIAVGTLYAVLLLWVSGGAAASLPHPGENHAVD